MSEQKGNGQEPQEEPMSRTKRITGQVKKLSQSEKVKNYLIGLGAVSALILGLVAQFKGEPVAEKTWETLRTSLNEQAEEINKIQKRLVYFQAWQEASTAMEIQKKLDSLQKRYDALKAKQTTAAVPKPAPTSTNTDHDDCKQGQVRGDDGKCRKVHKTVAVRVQKAAAAAAAAREALLKEKKRRLALERGKKSLMKRLMQQTSNAPAPKMLRALPKKLDDAARKK